LKALSTIQSLLRGETPALVVFDELEDAFPWQVEAGWLRKGSASAKAHTHRLLEENAVPCIWVGNCVDHLDPACLRRFSLVLELPPPPLGARHELLVRYASELDVPAELKLRLAENSWLTPAHAARAACVTRLVRRARSQTQSEAEVNRSGRGPRLSEAQVFERALRGERHAQPLSAAPALLDYDSALVNASVPLERLVCGLEQRGEGSVCLHGPPGTGKTAFATEMARRLQRSFTRRSVGDLLDKYVGGTERAIAEMFEEATRSGSVLLLDEAEGLLRDRRCAQQGFEVTQVNELLVRMETFRGIFLCATNSFEALDAASLRRFALRVEFAPLAPHQNRILFERTAQRLGIDFRSGIPRAGLRRLARLTQLTPGDYAAVLRGRLLIGDASIDTLLADLERAQAEKRAQRCIGFRAG
jgi:SpoVK/Ycf46/Vps4 family AAA+-type ATPase